MSRRTRYSVPAVVVGAGINGLGVVRSLARAGVPVIVVDSSADQPAMLSRYPRKVMFDERSPDGLLRVLETLAAEWAPGRAVLILTQEESVLTVATNASRLAGGYHLTLPSAEVVGPLLHKDGVRAVAEAAGARVPRTLRIQAEEEINTITSLRLPLVVKPALRDAGYASAFSKAYRFDDHGQADELLRRIMPVMPDVIVQEWIEGTDSDIYFCLQYLPETPGDPVSFVGRKIRSWPPRVGGTASCTAAPEAAHLAGITAEFFAHAGVTGLASMEYKHDAHSGEYVIVEPTVGRTDYQQEVATLNGVNLPLAAYCGALGLTLPEAALSKTAFVWRDWMSDTRSAQDTPAGETRQPKNARVVDAVWRAYDPMPALLPLAKRVGRRLARAGRRPVAGSNQE